MSMASPLDNDFVRETVKSPEDIILDTLRAQIKVVEDEKAAAQVKRVKQEEAESLRKQIRSYGLMPAA
jgi:hypothetical protein